jgi:hypothetical protein
MARELSPSSPSEETGKYPRNPVEPHENSKVVGDDLRGGAYKGKMKSGGIHSIPEHYQTQNGNTKELPDKKAKVTGGK